ncbi:hypothetical protein D3C73_1181490 [compost metagenome]
MGLGVHHFGAELPELRRHRGALQQRTFGGGCTENLAGRAPFFFHGRKQRIPNRRHHHNVLAGQLGHSGEEPLFGGAAVERRQEHHHRAVRRDCPHLCRNLLPIEFDQFSFQRGHGLDELTQQIALRCRFNPCAEPSVVGEEVHAVASALGQHGEQQRRLNSGIEPGFIFDSGGRCA